VKANISIEFNDNELDELLNFAIERYNEFDYFEQYHQGRIDGGKFAPIAPYQLKHAKSQCQFYKGIISKIRKVQADPEKRRAS